MLPATKSLPGLTRLDPLADRRQEHLAEQLRLGLCPIVGGIDPMFLYTDIEALGLATRRRKPNRFSYYRDDHVLWFVYTGDKPFIDGDDGKVVTKEAPGFGYSE